MHLIKFRDTFVRIIVSYCVITLSGISQAGSETRAEEGALRVIPRGRHGWRFTARIKFRLFLGIARELPGSFYGVLGVFLRVLECVGMY